MLFSSPIFVFAFLPFVLALYFVLPRALRNAVLLVASLAFYAWGEPLLSSVLLVSIVANHAFGLWVARARSRGRGRGVVTLAIAFNLTLLVVFKYADWLLDAAGSLLASLGVLAAPPERLGGLIPDDSWLRAAFFSSDLSIRLPLGISFFTFQATSYVIDIFRGDVEAERSLLAFGMYKSFFPQLVAGPIVRYRDVHEQIHDRRETLELFARGARRFVVGLGKKVLIANVCAQTADKVFGSASAGLGGIPPEHLHPAVAWLGLVAYTLQIYFDFSGYSDMAIGMAQLFGFRFLENFDHPYVACSITEFWRRWHISLSTWFRDYLYIPLGGNRHGARRTYVHLLIVFFLCGLWHGASLTFVAWGLLHGAFLVVERLGLAAWLERRGAWLRHAYVLLAVMVGWVLFRAETFGQAGHVLAALFGVQSGAQPVGLGAITVEAARLHPIALYADARTWLALAAGVVGSMPWLPAAQRWHARLAAAGRGALATWLELGGLFALALVFVGCALEFVAGSYNPFIYFRF